MVEDAVLFEQDAPHEVQRQVCPHDGYHAAFPVVHRVHVGHQGSRCVLSVEERLRPGCGILGYCLLEPFVRQIVVVGAAQHAALDLHGAVAPHGVRTEPASFLRVIAFDEADATTADARILADDASNDVLQTVGLVKLRLDVVDVVPHGHADIRHHVTDGSVGRYHAAVEISAGHFGKRSLDVFEKQEGQSGHHHEHHQHDPTRQPDGKRAHYFFRLFFVSRLFSELHNFFNSPNYFNFFQSGFGRLRQPHRARRQAAD